jgi:hypothetical protein
VIGRLGRVAALGYGALDQVEEDRGGCGLLLTGLEAELGRKAGRVKVKAYLFIKGTKQLNSK